MHLLWGYFNIYVSKIGYYSQHLSDRSLACLMKKIDARTNPCITTQIHPFNDLSVSDQYRPI